jgi:outer membrane protein insertion porin family
MLKFFFHLIILTTLFSFSAYSKNYKNIIINGNERISNETILVFSEIPEDKSLNENLLNNILKNLYNSGFFKDVVVKIEGNNLTIDVLENPIIQTVFINGVKSKKIKESIQNVLILKDRSSFNIINARRDELSIINLLKESGYYFSKIESSINELKNNKINLTYFIDIGDKAKISKISFIGDKKFKDSKLKSLIASEEYKFWKIVSGKKFLNEKLINFDKRLLNNFYKNKGYYKANIESSFANYLGNNNFELIFNINANDKYYFNTMKLNLPADFDPDNFINLTDIFDDLKGKPYSLNSISDILDEIDLITLNEQYEFLTSTVNESTVGNLINFEFNIQESEKFYVEKINIIGNNITREDVIRNNLAVDEGDAFNDLLNQKSINNLKSLNFFRNIDSKTDNGSSSGSKIITITVEEKPTGEISAGAGIGTNGGTVALGVTENNFLGRGIEFGSNLTLSEESIKGLFSMSNPNFRGTGRSLAVRAESIITDRLTSFGYKSNKTGASIASGFEYYNDIFLNTGVSAYAETIESDSTASQSIQNQRGSFFDTYLNYTIDYDKRDQRFQPSDGFRSRFTQNIPLVSDNYTLKNTYDYKFYSEWFNENIASFGFFASTANSISSKNVKLSDRVFIPSNKLRGFESGKVGPIDGSDYIGGNYSMSLNVNTTIPQILPNFENTDFSIFFDAANVWGIDYNSNLSDNSKIRSSIGLSVDLLTVIGPLNFSLTEVISKGNNDITESFRFNLGTTF